MRRFALVAGIAVVGACRSSGSAPPGSAAAGADAAAPVASAARPSPPAPPDGIGLSENAVASVVNPMRLPAYTGPTGAVEGVVLVRGPDAPDVPGLDVHACPAALDTYGKLFRAGPRRPDGARPLADALVVVTGYGGFYLPETSDVQRVTIGPSCGYPTRTLALTFGQRLEIANDSDVPFAPKIEGASQLSVMIAAPHERGEPVKIFPPRADYFPLHDELQKFVSGGLYVLRQPLHAVTDLDGRFRMDRVPVGSLKVSARLGSLLGEAVRDVDVRAGTTQKVQLVLTYAPDAGTGGRRAR